MVSSANGEYSWRGLIQQSHSAHVFHVMTLLTNFLHGRRYTALTYEAMISNHILDPQTRIELPLLKEFWIVIATSPSLSLPFQLGLRPKA
jgi:hypothetical protein